MSGADFLAILLCNERLDEGEPDPIMPIIRYLEGDKPVTTNMRNWLAVMLSKNGESAFQLKPSRRGKGSPGKKKAERFVYLRASSLKNELVTSEFVQTLKARTGWEIAPDNDTNPAVYRLGEVQRDQDGDYVEPRVALHVGRELSNRQIEEIISAESSWNNDPAGWVSLRTVQRYLKGWDRDEV